MPLRAPAPHLGSRYSTRSAAAAGSFTHKERRMGGEGSGEGGEKEASQRLKFEGPEAHCCPFASVHGELAAKPSPARPLPARRQRRLPVCRGAIGRESTPRVGKGAQEEPLDAISLPALAPGLPPSLQPPLAEVIQRSRLPLPDPLKPQAAPPPPPSSLPPSSLPLPKAVQPQAAQMEWKMASGGRSSL